MEADAKSLFYRCDKDNNGYLKVEEVKKCLVPRSGGNNVGGVYY